MTLKVGYSQDIITPSLDRPVFLAGFGQNRRAQTIHDDLFVRALALQTEQGTLVLCALDLIGFFRAYAREVAQRVHADLPQALKEVVPSIIIASIHPHHGPDTMGLWGPDDRTSGVDQDYLAELKGKIKATILASLTVLRPAGLKTASTHVPGLAKNARNPDILDDELTLAQFVGEQGQPLASLYNFPCHPEVLWEHNVHITSDYPGYLCRAVERETRAPCIFFSGALGGMMTPDVKDHSFEEAENMGERLALEGLRALADAALDPLPAMYIDHKEVKIKVTNILFKLALRRKLIPEVRDREGYITTEVNRIKIGDLWLATVPGEMLPKLGLALKAQLRQAGAGVAGVIGLANDELGYILPREDFRYPLNPLKPGKHYEETMSVSKDIGPQIMRAINDLL